MEIAGFFVLFTAGRSESINHVHLTCTMSIFSLPPTPGDICDNDTIAAGAEYLILQLASGGIPLCFVFN